MGKVMILLLLSLSLLCIGGCVKEKSVSDEAEIINLLNENLRAFQKEDLGLVKETTHSQNPSYEAVISFSEKIFDRYDLQYELVKYNIDKIDGDEALVSFTQITRKINGPEFRDNKVNGVHILRKESGDWKIYDTKVSNIEYL